MTRPDLPPVTHKPQLNLVNVPVNELKRLQKRERANARRAAERDLPHEPVNVEALIQLQGGLCKKSGKPLIFDAKHPDREAGKPIIAHECALAVKRSPGHVVGNVWLWRNDANQAEAALENSALGRGRRIRGETCRPKGSIPKRNNPWPPKGSRKIATRGFRA